MIKGGNAQEMFDGIPDQFYHFLASATRSASTTTSASLPLPLSFSLHHHHHHHHGGFLPFYPPPPPPPPPSFDSPPLPLSPPPHLLQQPQLFPFDHQLHHQSSHNKHQAKEEPHVTIAPSGLEPDDPWSNDEVLALLRIRSSVDTNWFPDFTWENVSRKLGELGFKRSAEKCKEKFEEETKSFNNSVIINNCNNKNIITNNYRLFGEFEDLYNSNSDHHPHHETPPAPLQPSDPNHDQANGHDPDTSSTQRKRTQSSKNGQNEEEQVEDEQEQEQEPEEDRTGQEKLLLGDDNVRDDEQSQSVNDSQETDENTKKVMRKRKRQKRFEMFKGFCEGIVNKMMAQQEELHCKIFQDMVKRDEEKIAKEEAWKKQENERFLKEMEVRAQELAVAGDRQAKLLDILDKFTSSNSLDVQSCGDAVEYLVKVPNNALSNSLVLAQGSMLRTQQPTSSCGTYHQSPNRLVTQNCQINMPTSSLNENVACQSSSIVDNSKLALPMSLSSIDQVSQNPNPATAENDHTSTDAADQNTDFRSVENQANAIRNVENKIKDDIGRRWPRDEVLALINIRCNLLNNNGDHHSQHDTKGPLWERISQKMMEVGYKRSARRCKEKWENINKYFRKTKDLNKKRSIDSRTCPYFHQLSHLYSQGTPVGTADRPTNRRPSSENMSVALPGFQGGSSASNGANTTMHDSQGNQGLVQAPAFDFEF